MEPSPSLPINSSRSAEAKMRLVITLSDDSIAKAEELIPSLVALGASDIHCDSFLGFISLDASADKLTALMSLPGVLTVEPSQEVNLSPPSSSIQ